MKNIKLLTILLTIASCVNAKAPQFYGCFDKAATTYHVPKDLLIAIAATESKFNEKATNVNKNGSEDIGIMQINSSWLPELAKYGITKEMLYDGCQNIMIGAWVLSLKIKSFGYNWTAVQRYNGSDAKLQYAKKVYDNYMQYSAETPAIVNNPVVANNNIQSAKAEEQVPAKQEASLPKPKMMAIY